MSTRAQAFAAIESIREGLFDSTLDALERALHERRTMKNPNQKPHTTLPHGHEWRWDQFREAWVIAAVRPQ